MGRQILCICYQGCSHGPMKKYANHWDYVAFQINAVWEVCVDVWCKNGQWFTGHDEPQYPIEKGYIIEWPDYMWYNCRDEESLRELVAMEEQRCFRELKEGETELTVAGGDDIGREMVFPGQRCKEHCLCFLPEENPRLDNWYQCNCLVTRFAHYYSIVFSYHEDQLNLRETQFDELLASDKIDDRRALSLYTIADRHNFQQAPEMSFDAMMKDLKNTFKDQNIFEMDSEKNVLHHLFMHIIGYEQFAKQFAYFEKYHKQYDTIIAEEMKNLLPYKMVLRGLIATKQRIMVVGYPSVDVNVWRMRIERKLQRKGLLYMRSVAKTAHLDVLRLSSEVSHEALKQFCAKYEHTYFGEMTVNQLTLGIGSVRMQERERQTLTNYTAPEGQTVDDTDNRHAYVVDIRKDRAKNQYEDRVAKLKLKEQL